MIRRLIHDRQASAAVEFALSLPMMLALLFGGFEAGHFFWTQHKIVKAVRDGARYASRLPIEDLCNGANEAMSDDTRTNIQNVTAKGALAGGHLVVPSWDPASVTVTVGCQDFVATGIYTTLGAAGPMITVASGHVTYPSLFNGLGILNTAVRLDAEASAAVTGV